MVYAMFVQSQWTVGSIGLVSGRKTEKNYYIGNHEKDAIIKYWWKILNIYIDYKRQAYQWVQLTFDQGKHYFSKLPCLKEEE